MGQCIFDKPGYMTEEWVTAMHDGLKHKTVLLFISYAYEVYN